MADDIVTYLAANIGTLNAAKNLFSNGTPEKKVDVVTVRDTGGAAPNQDYPVNDHSAQVELLWRANKLSAGMSLAASIFKLMNRKTNVTMGTKDVMFAQAVAPPQVVGQDEHGRWIITINFLYRVRDTYGEE